MAIIAVINQKGGVGKTTTVVNLAAYLAKAGKSVLVVDLDPQGNATSGLGVDKTKLDTNTYDVLMGQTLVGGLTQTAWDGIQILPTNQELAAAEIDLASKDKREFALKTALEPASFDFVLIDCPPSLGLLTINALVAADQLLIPVQTEYYALEGLGQLLSVMQRVRSGLNTKLELLGIVLTMYDTRTSLSGQVKDEIQKHFGAKLFKTEIPRNIRLAEAPSHGRPVSEHDKWSKGARAYKALAKEVMRHGK